MARKSAKSVATATRAGVAKQNNLPTGAAAVGAVATLATLDRSALTTPEARAEYLYLFSAAESGVQVAAETVREHRPTLLAVIAGDILAAPGRGNDTYSRKGKIATTGVKVPRATAAYTAALAASMGRTKATAAKYVSAARRFVAMMSTVDNGTGATVTPVDPTATPDAAMIAAADRAWELAARGDAATDPTAKAHGRDADAATPAATTTDAATPAVMATEDVIREALQAVAAQVEVIAKALTTDADYAPSDAVRKITARQAERLATLLP